MKRFLLPILTLAASCLTVVPAGAQTAQPARSSESVDRARTLFKQAEAAFGNENYGEARKLLLQAWALSKTYDVASALGQAELALKMFRDAAEHFDYALRNTLPTSNPEAVEATRKDFKTAKSQVAEARVTVNEEGAKIFADGKEIGTSPLPSSVYLEPGPHKLEARTSDGRTGVSQHLMTAGGSYPVTLVLADSPKGAVPPASGGGAEPRDNPPNYGPPIITAAAGGVLLFTGATFAVLSASKASSRDERLSELSGKSGTECGAGTPSATRCKDIQDLSQSAALFKTLAIGSFVGTAAAGVATYFLWPDTRKQTGNLQVVPSYSAADHSFHLGATGHF